MSTDLKRVWTREEYLAFERAAEVKHELLHGELVDMAGGTDRHSLIAVNFASELRSALRGRGCRVYSSDMKIEISGRRSFFYPDLSVVCGEQEFGDNRGDTLRNPLLIVEVLSPSTESRDRGRKFEDYRRILSFREYILVAQDRCCIDQFVRDSDTSWRLKTVTDLAGRLELHSLGCSVAIAEIYDQVVWADEPDPNELGSAYPEGV